MNQPKDSIPIHTSRLLSKHMKRLSVTNDDEMVDQVQHIVRFEPVIKEIKIDKSIKNNQEQNK